MLECACHTFWVPFLIGLVVLRCCVTAVHTHGLHVSHDDDDIGETTRCPWPWPWPLPCRNAPLHTLLVLLHAETIVLPGQSNLYSYHLAADHMAGTHWFHAHKHSSTNLQVAGGMAGVLLVEPADTMPLPADFAALYSDSSRQSVMMLNHVWLQTPATIGTGAFTFESLFNWAERFPDQTIAPSAEFITEDNLCVRAVGTSE